MFFLCGSRSGIGLRCGYCLSFREP
jgi:hypothetical protein